MDWYNLDIWVSLQKCLSPPMQQLGTSGDNLVIIRINIQVTFVHFCVLFLSEGCVCHQGAAAGKTQAANLGWFPTLELIFQPFNTMADLTDGISCTMQLDPAYMLKRFPSCVTTRILFASLVSWRTVEVTVKSVFFIGSVSCQKHFKTIEKLSFTFSLLYLPYYLVYFSSLSLEMGFSWLGACLPEGHINLFLI